MATETESPVKEVVEETDHTGLKSVWMKNWPSLDPTEPQGQPVVEEKEEPNVSPPAPAAKGNDAPVGKPADPAPPKAEPKPEPKAEPVAAEETPKPKGPEPGEEKWPRTSADWDKFKKVRKEREESLRKEIQTREERIKELTTKYQEVEKKANEVKSVDPEVDRLKKINDELTNRIMVLDVTQDPRFQTYFENKTQAQIQLAKNIVGAEKADAIAKALQLPNTPEYNDLKNTQIEELIADLSPLQQGRISSVLNILDEIGLERQAEIAKAGQHKGTIAEKNKETQAKAIAARDKMLSDAIMKVQDEKEGMAIFQMRDGDEQWNGGVAERIATARKLLTGDGAKPAEIVQAAFHAAAFPAVLEAYKADMQSRDEQIEKLEAQVKAMSAAQPKKGGSPTPAPGEEPQGVPVKIGMSPHDAAQNFVRSLGSLNG